MNNRSARQREGNAVGDVEGWPVRGGCCPRWPGLPRRLARSASLTFFYSRCCCSSCPRPTSPTARPHPSPGVSPSLKTHTHHHHHHLRPLTHHTQAPLPRSMHKLSTFTGSARHGWEKMTPQGGFPFSRSSHDVPVSAPPPQMKRPSTATSAPPPIAPGSPVSLSFNVPFASQLAGPEPEDIIYASPGAMNRWTHPEKTAADAPPHKLPIHVQNVENLRNLCRDITDSSDGKVVAAVVSTESKPTIPGSQKRTQVTNVCLSGALEVVHQLRCNLLNATPIAMVGRCIASEGVVC